MVSESSLVICIRFHFTRSSFSCRNNSGCVITVRVGNNKQTTINSKSNHEETIFVIGMIWAIYRKGMRGKKHGSSVQKADAMLFEVRIGLIGVPFKFYLHLVLRITSETTGLFRKICGSLFSRNSLFTRENALISTVLHGSGFEG